MATRTVIEPVDDQDGSEATETARFALDGSECGTDLTGQNPEELRGVLARDVEVCRRAGLRIEGRALLRLRFRGSLTSWHVYATQ